LSDARLQRVGAFEVKIIRQIKAIENRKYD